MRQKWQKKYIYIQVNVTHCVKVICGNSFNEIISKIGHINLDVDMISWC